MRSLRSPHPTLSAEQGAVVSACPIASAFGYRALQEGGNAVDAAVTTALALAVTYPQAGNLGGGGFLVLHLPTGEDLVLDFRETAPRGLRLEHFVDASGLIGNRTIFGALAVGVPGTVAGLAEVLAGYGTFSWARCLAPALELAEQGVWLTTRQSRYYALYRDELARAPSTAHVFLLPDGRPPLPGTLFRQGDLARTLRVLITEGPRSMYEGIIAEQVCDEISRGGGVLDAEDLRAYRPVWRTPETLALDGRHIVLPPLPSGGGTILHAVLTLCRQLGLAERARSQAEQIDRLDLLGRIFRVAYAYRRPLAGDPDHWSAEEAKRASCDPFSTMDRQQFSEMERTVIGDPTGSSQVKGGENTTHFCVFDGQGGAVSCTTSLNTLFGAKLVVGGAGFLLNSCIDDFYLGTANWYDLMQSDCNRLGPAKRPVSSMCPTIVTRDQKVELILGAAGGPRIPTVLSQLLLSLLIDGHDLDEAIRAPRIHHQHQPSFLYVEQRVPQATVDALVARGHRVERTMLLGIAAGMRHAGGTLTAMLDPRFMTE
jgi:gamma-glutamyltranspeptidase/glutathione hydrolase